MVDCTLSNDNATATITLNDPEKRNALSSALFEALESAIAEVSPNESIRVVVLTGAGKVFCAGFDLGAANKNSSLMTDFIRRLSNVNRSLRAIPVPVIASVRGAAIAGGCAMLSACDFVVTEANAKFGYPVHAIGVSPAVTLPTLAAAIGPGAARSLVISGQLIDGREAHRLGLVTHLAAQNDDDSDALDRATDELARSIATKPPHAVRVTKAWLNQLDRTNDAERFEQFAEASAAIAEGEEAVTMLRQAWASRPKKD